MIAVPTAPWAHYIGDFTAWSAAAFAGYWQNRRWHKQVLQLSRSTNPDYFLALGICALIGAWVCGSANTLRISFTPSHSIAGALAGGIVGVEVWKWRHGIRRSTGGAFVLPICVGIVVGRFGCLFSGIADYTYGVPTSLPWAVNLGDGIDLNASEHFHRRLIASAASLKTIFGVAVRTPDDGASCKKQRNPAGTRQTADENNQYRKEA